MDADEYFDVAGVSAYLKVSPRTIYRLLARGELPGLRVGSSWRFSRKAIDQWAREQRDER